ncbi:tetratricopeptide repeat protein [soil metagenome]
MRRYIVVVLLAAAMVVGAGVALGGPSTPGPTTASGADPAALGRVNSDRLDDAIAALQTHLRTQPKDARSWATLGVAYVEQARLTGDPTYYPKAEGVLRRSMQEQAQDNEAALTGMAALGAARHDFAAALSWTDKSLAVNPTNAQTLAVRTDALVELGRYDAAQRVAARADNIAPGIPTFTRLSYLAELHGDLAEAERLLQLARRNARVPSDVAFVRVLLGDLARRQGRLAAADDHYAAALAVRSTDVPALVGRSRVASAEGNLKKAATLLTEAVTRRPVPEYLIALGELYQARGDQEQAAEQYAVVRGAARLAAANGVSTDLELAIFEADHGDPAAALRSARAEWARRHSIHAADALGWALHASGRDREALRYARSATRLGTKDARLLFHRGMIEAALGRDAQASRTLRDALAADPHFSPLHAPVARRTLGTIDRS